VVEEEPYLLELVRYIHLNPVRAGVVPDLRPSPLSVVRPQCPRGDHRPPWQATETILGHFGPSTLRARSAYRAFVTAGVAQGRRPEFQGGGLRRSVGSWAEVHALRQAGTPTAADARILGAASSSSGC